MTASSGLSERDMNAAKPVRTLTLASKPTSDATSASHEDAGSDVIQH